MSNILDNIIQSLNDTERLHKQIAEQDLTVRIRNLQAWQTKRLLTTHSDLWESKRFNPAMQFFVDEIYGPKDFSQRDSELARVVPKMVKILPNKALVSLQAALKLNSLSLQLDLKILENLGDSALDRDSYFNCYRESDNRVLREEQIQLLEDLGTDLAEVVKISGISAILMLSRKPARVAGVQTLHEFLERGFKSFKKLGKVNDFIDPIINRERQMMDLLFCATHPQDNPLPKIHS